jgi:hypothetical protein
MSSLSLVSKPARSLFWMILSVMMTAPGDAPRKPSPFSSMTVSVMVVWPVA